MALSKARKEELVAQYIDLIEKSDAVFLAEYTGLNVNKMESLRLEIGKANGAFHVTKNTLLHHALQEVNIPVPDELLTGQLASGFALEEAPTLAKALVNFADKEENLTLKGGFLGPNFLTAAEIEALAKLPSLDQLRAQILGLISAPAQNVAGVIASGMRQVINVIDAYAKTEEGSDPEAETSDS